MKKRAITMVLLLGFASAVFAQEQALNSVGALTAAYMYTAYLAIGAIADSHYYEVYDDETTVQLMGNIKGFAGAANESLQLLVESDLLSPEDFSYVNELISTLRLLFQEAESYQSYIETGEERYAAIYDSFRENAWSKIAVLLEIEE